MSREGGAAKRSWARRVLNLGLVATFMTFVGLIVGAGIRSANRDAEMHIAIHEAQQLFEAFERFYKLNRHYPRAYTGRALDLESLDPLRVRGYYRGAMTAKLRGHRADAYDSPDDQGQNQEFWLEMTLEADPSIRLLIADSDDAPLSGGETCRGAYLYRGGVLERL